MKTFKIADCLIQFILFSFAAGLFIGRARDTFFIYFVVAGWQLLSALIHIWQPGFNLKKLRRIYLFILLFVILTGLAALLFEPAIMIFAFTIIYVLPVMAVYYCIVCVKETTSFSTALL